MNEAVVDESSKIAVKLLDKTFQIKCPDGQEATLHAAANRVNKEMRKMRQAGVVGVERIAMITALNLAGVINELESQLENKVTLTAKKIQEIQRRIDEALTQAEQLEL
jgi:cell division protein ZapA